MNISNKIKMTREAIRRLDDAEFVAQCLIGKDETLQRCLDTAAAFAPDDGHVEISCDFAPLSFLFHAKRSDGKASLCGGIIFHSPAADALNLSISLSGNNKPRWEIHT